MPASSGTNKQKPSERRKSKEACKKYRTKMENTAHKMSKEHNARTYIFTMRNGWWHSISACYDGTTESRYGKITPSMCAPEATPSAIQPIALRPSQGRSSILTARSINTVASGPNVTPLKRNDGGKSTMCATECRSPLWPY